MHVHNPQIQSFPRQAWLLNPEPGKLLDGFKLLAL